MSGYNLDEFVHDFSERTTRNMKEINRSGNGLEVTQLINSLMGLIVIPNGAYYRKHIGKVENQKMYCGIIDKIDKMFLSAEMKTGIIVVIKKQRVRFNS